MSQEFYFAMFKLLDLFANRKINHEEAVGLIVEAVTKENNG